jgi:hypothetical protein
LFASVEQRHNDAMLPLRRAPQQNFVVACLAPQKKRADCLPAYSRNEFRRQQTPSLTIADYPAPAHRKLQQQLSQTVSETPALLGGWLFAEGTGWTAVSVPPRLCGAFNPAQTLHC